MHSLPDKSGKLYVTCGIMQTKVQLSDLELIQDDGGVTFNGASAKGSRSSLKRAFAQGGSGSSGGSHGSGGSGLNLDRAKRMTSEINLLGMTTDEAILELDKYLDDARMAHMDSVRVVHGKGTGALRSAVQQYLRKQRWVKSYRSGDFGEGDAGVTIVEL